MCSETGSSLRRRRRRVPPLGIVVLLLVPLLLGYHWARAGWRDWHYNYPAKPYGYDQIVSRFGLPCNSSAKAISMKWTAADNGYTYTVYFHKKLGGYPTEMVSDKGGRSTNLDNDVYGHIQNEHLSQYVKYGIYGYACRKKRGNDSQYSTHAWGIAVDVSSASEPMGHCYSTTNKYHASIWRNHNWHWGIDFCDPMHFQYAEGY